MSSQSVIFRDLGKMDYQTAWDIQEKLLREKVEAKSRLWESVAVERSLHGMPPDLPATEIPHHLLFVEHLPVYTLGKSGKKEHVLIDDEELKNRDISFFNTNRGGDITFHGPGQIVGYPILDLERFYTDIGKYLRNIEEVIILTLRDYGIEAGRSKGETGVWIDADIPGRERKICAIGVRCSRWITMHGFAFNVNTDLGYFNHIIPCGISGKQVTSLHNETGHAMDMEEVKNKVKKNFGSVFDVSFVNE